jgi:hypothetical protein
MHLNSLGPKYSFFWPWFFGEHFVTTVNLYFFEISVKYTGTSFLCLNRRILRKRHQKCYLKPEPHKKNDAAL